MDSYQGARVLVTGGLGFIGSNLTIRLVEQGAQVTVVDSSISGCGANPFNIEPVRDRVTLIPLDLSHAAQFRVEIAAVDLVFNLAGEISHIHSMRFPERDLQINALAQLRFLLECASAKRGMRVVYASTRQLYGAPDYLPVDENHPIRPIDFNGIHKAAACMYHLMLSRSGELDAVVLRLTNVYGPRMALNIPAQGFLGTFLRRALTSEPIEVFGDGLQLRDPVYVDDAVDAFLLAGLGTPPSRTYNVGGIENLPLNKIAAIIAREGGEIAVTRRAFPDDIKPIDIGSYATDSTRIASELEWRPQVRFSEGIRRTLDFFRLHSEHYLPLT